MKKVAPHGRVIASPGRIRAKKLKKDRHDFQQREKGKQNPWGLHSHCGGPPKALLDCCKWLEWGQAPPFWSVAWEKEVSGQGGAGLKLGWESALGHFVLLQPCVRS